jgi:hypothetical protein
MFFQILFVLLESTHFKEPDGSENEKKDRNGLNTFFPWTLQIGSDILLSTLFSNSLNLYASVRVSEQVSHKHEVKLWFCRRREAIDFELNGSKHTQDLMCSLFLHEYRFVAVIPSYLNFATYS